LEQNLKHEGVPAAGVVAMARPGAAFVLGAYLWAPACMLLLLEVREVRQVPRGRLPNAERMQLGLQATELLQAWASANTSGAPPKAATWGKCSTAYRKW